MPIERTVLPSPSAMKTLTDTQLAEVLALTKGADTVELKLTVPLSDRSRAGAALGVDPLDSQIRQVYFFDTPDLALNKSGLVVRARRVQRREDDSVEAAPGCPGRALGERTPFAEFRCRGRRDAGGLCLLGLHEKRKVGTTLVRDSIVGDQKIRKLFSRNNCPCTRRMRPTGSSSTTCRSSARSSC